MKRYMVFYWSVYYPKGGTLDFINDSDDLEEATQSLLDHFEDDGGNREYNEGIVFDTLTKENLVELYTHNQ